MSAPAELGDRDRSALHALLGADRVLDDPDLTSGYSVDWTGRFRGDAPAVVRPRNAEEVAELLAWCDDRRIAVVPQGGNTGLVGGSVPLHGEVVLSLRGLDHLGEVDAVEAQVTVGAGVTIATLAEHAGGADLAYGVDLASRDSATVGGTIATDAGGVHVMCHGTTRDQVIGLEAVLADGRVLRHVSGVTRDRTGYDLAQLLCGSEGTLAVVTEARMRLVPRPASRCVALVAFESASAAVAAVAGLRRRLSALAAAELMLASGIDLVCDQFERRPPLPDSWPVVVLLEASGPHDVTDRLAAALADTDGVRDSVLADDSTGRDALWAYREDHTLAINQLGPPHKLDVAVPLRSLARFLDDVTAAVAELAPQARVWLFGHVGEGSVHVNVTGLAPDDERIDAAVLELVARFEGSISAEHGIGTVKRRWLHLARSPAELEAFRAIKGALDPHGILNPHVLLP